MNDKHGPNVSQMSSVRFSPLLSSAANSDPLPPRYYPSISSDRRALVWQDSKVLDSGELNIFLRSVRDRFRLPLSPLRLHGRKVPDPSTAPGQSQLCFLITPTSVTAITIEASRPQPDFRPVESIFNVFLHPRSTRGLRSLELLFPLRPCLLLYRTIRQLVSQENRENQQGSHSAVAGSERQSTLSTRRSFVPPRKRTRDPSFKEQRGSSGEIGRASWAVRLGHFPFAGVAMSRTRTSGKVDEASYVVAFRTSMQATTDALFSTGALVKERFTRSPWRYTWPKSRLICSASSPPNSCCCPTRRLSHPPRVLAYASNALRFGSKERDGIFRRPKCQSQSQKQAYQRACAARVYLGEEEERRRPGFMSEVT